MRTHIIVLLLIFIIVTLSACREITVTTRVNNDGSFTRIITITGDSADLFKKDLPYPVDDSWLFEVKHDSVDTSMFVTYTKTYTNSIDLNKEIDSDTSWKKQLRRSIEVNKKFGFFFSYLTFKEVIKSANPFTMLDYSDHLTPEELMWLNKEKLPLTEADTTIMEEIEEKALEFVGKSITEELIVHFEEGIKKLNDPAVNPGIIRLHYDSILAHVYEWEFENSSALIDNIAIWSDESRVLDIKQFFPELFADFNKKVELFDNVLQMEIYDQVVEMPGIITETNSPGLIGNQVSWDVDSDCFLFNDYTMYVESRVVNVWSFILLGLVLVSLIIFLTIKSFRN